jgi:hypothetical protein
MLNRKIVFVSIFFLLTQNLYGQLMQKIHLKRPEGDTISFYYMDRQIAETMLAPLSYQEITDPNELGIAYLKKQALLFDDGRVVKVLSNTHVLLFDNKTEYLKSIRSELYLNVHICHDEKTGIIYANFNLDTLATPLFYNQKHYIDDKYPSDDGSKVYVLENGEVCYLLDRTATFKQGWWFQDIHHFEYFFDNVFTAPNEPKRK